MYTGAWDCYGRAAPHGHHHNPAMLIPREIDADSGTPSRDGLVGGMRPAALSLEYLVEAGASAPAVKVSTAADGSSATWSEDSPKTGYTVREAVLTVSPGTKVTLTVNNVTARLRWCEMVCC
jgi:hypothetical protein